jgi:hypothetical protein
MPADRGIGAVKDRTGGQQCLCGQEAAVAGVGHKTLGAGRQFALQPVQQRGTGFGILARLFLIASNDITPALDLDLLHRQIGFAPLTRDGQRH